MGCHTWFYAPALEGKEEIIKLAQENLDENPDGYDESTVKMYQLAIDNELLTPCKVLAAYGREYHKYYTLIRNGKWILYKEPAKIQLDNYNKINGTDISIYDVAEIQANKIKLDYFPDDPRIDGYPDDIIDSYEKLIEVIETGLVDQYGELQEFYFTVDKEYTLSKIKWFFDTYPGGVITFG